MYVENTLMRDPIRTEYGYSPPHTPCICKIDTLIATSWDADQPWTILLILYSHRGNGKAAGNYYCYNRAHMGVVLGLY